jgi:hypothetical protein
VKSEEEDRWAHPRWRGSTYRAQNHALRHLKRRALPTSSTRSHFSALVGFEIFSEDEGRGLGFERGFLHVNSLKGL